MPETEVSTAYVDNRHPDVVAQHERLNRLRDEIFELGLERNIVELELYGYTIIHDVKPASFFDELRERILELGEQDKKLGHIMHLSGEDGGSFLVKRLLHRGRIFEEAVMAEKPLAVVTYLLGESCQISSSNGHVRAQGDPPQFMHSDAPFVPEPLPNFAHTCNMMWCTEDFTYEAGGTLVVPGSHKNCSHPLPGSTTRKMAIPVEARKGSVIVFTGHLWHCAGARTLPGVRVGMTVYFSRMYARQQEPLNDLISDEIVARNSSRFAELIGRNNPYPSTEYGFDRKKIADHITKTKDPRG
ncbi:MAG: phytanoyl-CoA dioxygenase family protein [Candidatus Hydrogenedentota bacterium]